MFEESTNFREKERFSTLEGTFPLSSDKEMVTWKGVSIKGYSGTLKNLKKRFSATCRSTLTGRSEHGQASLLLYPCIISFTRDLFEGVGNFRQSTCLSVSFPNYQNSQSRPTCQSRGNHCEKTKSIGLSIMLWIEL